MNSIGMLSAYSAYTGISSVYGPAPVSAVKDKQGIFDANISPVDDINDTATISDEAKVLFETEQSDTQNNSAKDEQKTQDPQQAQGKKPEFTEELTLEEKQTVAKLKAIDIKVKSHEQAHMAAASGINVSAPSYSYQTGPDGKKYAVGGEVSISFNKSENPEENLAKARTMKAAALAPADPSSQDRAVARSADKLIAEAEKEIAAENKEAMDASKKPDETEEISDAQDTSEAFGDTETKTAKSPMPTVF